MEHLKLDLEVKFAAGSTDGTFSGYGAMFGNVDSYGDVIEKGAFKDTLRSWEGKGKLPPMLLQHGGGFMGGADDMLPVGKWNSMEENSKGLKVEGQLFAMSTERGQYLYEGLKAGSLDGLSIGYRPVKFVNGTKAGEPRRTLQAVDLVELSIVTFPANDKARVGAVKAGDIKTIREFEDFLRDLGGFSHAAAKAIAARGYKSTEPRDEDGAMNDLLRTLREARAGLTATPS
jgi:HK97 family phage prohead protease